MKHIAPSLVLALISLSCSKPAGPAAPGPSSPLAARKIKIAAAASLRDILDKSVEEFRKSRPGCKVVFSFDASSALSRQISEGADFAVFLSADADSVTRIGDKAKAPQVFLTNRLRMVGPAGGSAFTPQSVSSDHKAAICGPEVPAGKAWRKYLEGKGWLAAVERHSTIATNVRAALALFESEAVSYAFVYATDARACKRAHGEWTPQDGPVTTYVGTEVAGNAGEDSKAFLEWVSGTAFREAAKAQGFEDPPGK